MSSESQLTDEEIPLWKRRMSRRKALSTAGKVGVAAVGGLVVGGAAGYFGGTSIAPLGGGQSASNLPSQIVVGGVMPLSPPGNSAAGTEQKNGMQLLFDQVNNKGGILGRPVNFVIEDTKGTASEGTTAFTRLVDKGAAMVIGEYHSSVAVA